MIYWKAPQILSFYFLKTFKIFPPSSPLLSFESAPFPFFTWSIVAHFLLRLQFHPFLSTLHSLKIHSERGKNPLMPSLGPWYTFPEPWAHPGAGSRAQSWDAGFAFLSWRQKSRRQLGHRLPPSSRPLVSANPVSSLLVSFITLAAK